MFMVLGCVLGFGFDELIKAAALGWYGGTLWF